MEDNAWENIRKANAEEMGLTMDEYEQNIKEAVKRHKDTITEMYGDER